jgi:hypothetical protein
LRRHIQASVATRWNTAARHGLRQERALEAGAEVAQRDAAPFRKQAHVGQHRAEHLQPVAEGVELGRLVERHLKRGGAPDRPGELFNRRGVLGRELEQVLTQAVGVVVERDGPAVGGLVREERLEVDDLRALQRAHLAPVFVERALAGADEPVQAAVEGVIAAFPRRA